MIRFALYGMFEPVSALVVAGSTVVFFLLAVDRLRPATRHDPPRRAAGVSRRDSELAPD